MAPTKTVVTCIWLVEKRKVTVGPIEAAGINHHATDAVAVSTQPLGKGMNHDVTTVFDRAGKVRG